MMTKEEAEADARRFCPRLQPLRRTQPSTQQTRDSPLTRTKKSKTKRPTQGC